MPRPPATSFRFPPATTQQIKELIVAKDGLPATRVLILAIDRLHADVCRPVAAGKPRTRTVKES